MPRVAAVQMDIAIGEVERNLRHVLDRLGEAAAHGAELIVFPEAALSGYCFGGLSEAVHFTCGDGDDALEAFALACMKHEATGVLGFLEGLSEDEELNRKAECCRNSAFVCTPIAGGGSLSYVYRKTHLPVLGVDRYVTPGDGLEVLDTLVGKIGPLICYDIRFPEAARSLALDGAEIIVLPTNWPEGAESSPDFLTRARAWENRVFLVAADRVGVERGRRFIGRSQIVAPSGKVLAEAGADEETILYADIDLEEARQKRIVIEQGEWELDVIGGRRPDLYGRLVQ